ncbi:MAG: hypothetical protein COS92_00895 [Desulfobacterales bacterium CG07_land_8_20_14_0_80_52_14]|nr:MAG: hypothetical protein COX20_10045 [Desulfobacterales bacterium CG23_combo_of_CG06-09_8_20_14_all_52_9]PIU50533.1 MAG: hypothetical protein COS92_00895 [Desulfobacterales bacterium CG07_land_8_20_14_0_80_52_14]
MQATLLIIDGDPAFRENLGRHLQGNDWQIRFAGGMVEAEKMVKRRNIDVALLGMASLKREGIEILRMIKKLSSQTEVIMIGGSEQIALSIEGMKWGAFDDFMGPFEIDSLISRIHDVLGQRKRKLKDQK